MNRGRDDDEFLLGENFNRLLVRKQPKIRSIASIGIRNGFFDMDDLEDAIQEINKRLLEKSSHIQQNYNGLSTVDAYLQTVIYHEFCKYARTLQQKREKVDRLDDKLAGMADRGISSFDEMVIGDEIKRLDAIFKLYPRQRFRLMLLIKILSRVPIDENDIDLGYPRTKPVFQQLIIKKINELLNCADVDLFREFATFLEENQIDHLKPESLLHFTRDKIKEMVNLLNSTSLFNSTYDTKSFLLLAERYFTVRKSSSSITFAIVFGYILLGLKLLNYL